MADGLDVTKAFFSTRQKDDSGKANLFYYVVVFLQKGTHIAKDKYLQKKSMKGNWAPYYRPESKCCSKCLSIPFGAKYFTHVQIYKKKAARNFGH